MTYGMPCYEKKKIFEVAFASQKNFIALYILKQDVMVNLYKPVKRHKYGQRFYSLYKIR